VFVTVHRKTRKREDEDIVKLYSLLATPCPRPVLILVDLLRPLAGCSVCSRRGMAMWTAVLESAPFQGELRQHPNGG